MLVEYYIRIQHFAREVIENVMTRYIIVKFSTARASISDILTLSDGINKELKGFIFVYFTCVTILYFKHNIFAKCKYILTLISLINMEVGINVEGVMNIIFWARMKFYCSK